MINITERVEPDCTTLTISGHFDIQVRKQFQMAFKQAHASNPHHLIFNLTQVSFIDSSPIAALILAHRTCLTTGTSLSLVVPPGLVLDSLHLMNIGDTIPIHTTEHTTTPSLAHQ